MADFVTILNDVTIRDSCPKTGERSQACQRRIFSLLKVPLSDGYLEFSKLWIFF